MRVRGLVTANMRKEGGYIWHVQESQQLSIQCDRHKVLQSPKRVVKTKLLRAHASYTWCISFTFLYYAHATHGINITPYPCVT